MSETERDHPKSGEPQGKWLTALDLRRKYQANRFTILNEMRRIQRELIKDIEDNTGVNKTEAEEIVESHLVGKQRRKNKHKKPALAISKDVETLIDLPERKGSDVSKSMSGGIVVRSARDVLGMTQAELAVQLGVSPARISRWELGDSPITEIYANKISRLISDNERSDDWVQSLVEGTAASIRSLGYEEKVAIDLMLEALQKISQGMNSNQASR